VWTPPVLGAGRAWTVVLATGADAAVEAGADAVV
jgi:hypothetical protein